MSDHDYVPSDAELDQARGAVEGLLASSTLGDEGFWIDPSDALEEHVMAAISQEEAGAAEPREATRRIGLAWVAAGIAAAAVVVVAVVGLRPAGPDWEVALGATPNAPGVVATVSGWNETSGTRMELDIEGLEPAPDGFIYELWLSEGPIHISAGTFHRPEDVTLWAGVSRGDYPRLWITLEPIADGDPGPGLNLLDTGDASGVP